MGRRILNRRELRADFDAAKRRQGDEAGAVVDNGDQEDNGDGQAGAETTDAENPEAPAKPKAAKPKAKAKPRTRTAKVVRMKVVWGVFNNSNQRVAVFDYPKREEADALAAKLKADKKVTHFVQPVKEPFEEKKAE